jgi:hypothetical protein
VGDHSEWLALQYLTNVWGAEPPVYPRPLCQPDPPNLADSIQGSPGTSAIFLTRRAAAADPSCLADWHRYAAGASLIQAQDIPNTQLPKSARLVTYEFGPSLRLVGYEIQPTLDGELANTSTAPWHLSLYWQADLPMDLDYTVSVRPLRQGELILADDGEPLIQDHQPVWSRYPTSRWSPGEVVRDDYVLSLPNQAIPDGVQIVVYRTSEAGFENLGEAQLYLGADVPE